MDKSPGGLAAEFLLRSNDSAPAGRRETHIPTFIDVFAGCGGLTLGLMRAGWRGLFAIEKDAFAFATLEANFLQPSSRYQFDWPGWLPKEAVDIRVLLERHTDELRRLSGAVDLLAGGPPCQGFSAAGRRKPHDPRNELFRDYVALVELVRPRVILFENVEGITYPFGEGDTPGEGADRDTVEPRESYAKAIERTLAKSYHVFTSIVRCSQFGIPQSRPRFILVGYSMEFFKKRSCDRKRRSRRRQLRQVVRHRTSRSVKSQRSTAVAMVQCRGSASELSSPSRPLGMSLVAI
jgi:DNA (cytosine-5)-methyltransferase 1